MLFLNPLAWIGLAAVAVPILIHLLARQASAPVPFPTLRFLRATPLLDLRRRRLSDWLLLAVRVAIIALAVTALAQPFIATTRSAGAQRLVIIDASPSVDAEAARQAARALADDGTQTRVIERARLVDAAREAGTWALAQAGTSTVLFISDFQRGAFDAGVIEALPASTGIVLHQLPRRDLGALPFGVTRLTFDGGRTTAAWARQAITEGAIQLDGTFDAATAAAIIDAGIATAEPRVGTLRPATFVMPDSPRRQAWIDRARAPGASWMFDVLAAITPGRAETIAEADGRAIIFLAPGDAAATADAIREAVPALATGPAPGELEPLVIDGAELRAMERTATPVPPADAPASWAGRWFWLAALVLLGVEGWLRRSRRAAAQELAHAA